MYNVNNVYLADGVFFQLTLTELLNHKYPRTPLYRHLLNTNNLLMRTLLLTPSVLLLTGFDYKIFPVVGSLSLQRFGWDPNRSVR